ncbi:hypothetical protein BD414DRAFT_140839 [Trametes punicea]|nr:hypothetical protein BD414DRAFT_140839 [Trametes punicea]
MPSISELRSRACSMIEAEQESLRRLEAEIVEIVALRNKFAPINLLPPELLIQIFSHLQSNGDLVAATHVCGHWRAVATGAPELWTSFKFEDVSLATAFFERSKTLPLALYLKLTAKHTVHEMIAVVEPHVYRIHFLDVEFLSLDDVVAFSTEFDRPALALKKLGLYLEEKALDEPPDIVTALEDIPQMFPNVQELALDNLPFVDLLNPLNLTVLHLDGFLPSFTDVLQTLRHCSSLLDLMIHGSPFYEPSEEPSAYLVVNLPRLRKAAFHVDSPDYSLTILAHLALPDSVIVAIATEYQEGDFVTAPDIACMRGLQRFCIQWLPNDILCASAWRTLEPTATECLKLTLVGISKLTSPVLSEWPVDVSEVRRLEIDFGWQDPDELFRYLNLFPNVETLRAVRLTKHCMSFLCQALGSISSRATRTRTAVRGEESFLTYLPRLRSVEIGCLRWTTSFVRDLREVVVQRERFGHDAFILELSDVQNYYLCAQGGPHGDLGHARVGIHGIEEEPAPQAS